MPTVLSDPSSTLYTILGVTVIVALALLARSQKRQYLYQFLIAAAVLLLVFLIDFLVESPREQAVRKMKEMATATQSRRMDDAFRHISESFKYKNMNKAGLREKARFAEGVAAFSGVGVSSFERSEFKEVDDKTIQVGFEVFLTNAPLGDFRFWCVGTFVKDPDGEWRFAGMRFSKASEGPTGAEVVPQGMES